MIDCSFFYDTLAGYGVKFLTGVPDSILKDFCAYVTDNTPAGNHIIAANEGGAVALACGHYLATGQTALVYMQNSGQGNATNPLISLADADVYSIPVLLLIGWRGQPGQKDEPQHIKQGKITQSFLDTLAIPYSVLPDSNERAKECVEQLLQTAKKTSAPAALIVQKGAFAPYLAEKDNNCSSGITRENAIIEIVKQLDESDIIVSTTGKTSRELYEYRDRIDGDHSKDFLTVGSMGHASQIALGITLAKQNRQVFVLDGDGAAIMHLGAMVVIGSNGTPNFKHIILNNGCHDSVGGQPTAGFSISFTQIAKACGYKFSAEAADLNEISKKIQTLKKTPGPGLLEIKVRKGARADLGRPKTSPQQNKAAFMGFLAD